MPLLERSEDVDRGRRVKWMRSMKLSKELLLSNITEKYSILDIHGAR